MAGTTANGINVSDVNILFSTDGGKTFPFTLATTANDGSHVITVPNIDSTEARIKVEAVGNVFFDVTDSVFIVESDPSSAGVTVTQTDGNTNVGEDGLVGGFTTDTYTLELNTVPTGTVEVTVSADAQTEVSLDGTNYFTSVIVNLADTSAQSVTVRGFDDTLLEGIHSGLITHAITSSPDPNYPVETLINPLSASIADDELQPVVGVDFDQGGGDSPTNWTLVSQQFGGTTSNLIREDGITTGIGLTLGVGGSAGLNASAPDAVPLHSPSLEAIDGNHIASDSLTLTWTGLTAGTDYHIYLLLTENFSSDAVQNVTVTGGAGNPLPFTQDTQLIGNGLLVNSGLANPSKTLEADAVIAQADADGEIQIVVTNVSVDSNDNAILAGAAIQEVGPDTIGFSVIQTGDSTTVSESGTSDTFDVVLKSQPSTNVVIDVSSNDTGEATVSPTTLTFTPANWNAPQTVTVTGVDDALSDGAQTSIVTMAVNDGLSDDAYDSVGDRTLIVSTQDNEATPLVGVDFDSTGPVPTNWTQITDTFGSTTNNLIREDGTSSQFDLTVAVSGGG